MEKLPPNETIFTPEVSVIMTSYNAEKTISEAIDSILSQTFTDFEFIIVDDGSTDSTLGIILNYRDERIHLVKQCHRGRVPSLNHAVGLTQGEYIANLDADDIALPERLDRQIAYLEDHPEIGLLGAWGIEMNEYSGQEKEILLPVTNEEIRTALAFYCPFIHSSAMIRQCVFKNVGLYNERLTHSEDLDLWVRIATDYTIANLPEFLVKKRIHPLQSFKIVKEEARFRNEACLCWRAARCLSLPLSVKLSALSFYLYSRIPFQFRKGLKTVFPTGWVRLMDASRDGWVIK